MSDLSLNSNFSVYLDDRNDLATVEGRDALEQSITVMLTEFQYETLPGLTRTDNIEEKIRLEITRVARSHGSLDKVADILISQKDDAPDTYQVRIAYISGDISLISEEVTAQ